ncbi:MAG: ribonuclease Y [Armatimonadetes bacterium]|nr:ribonuclease Y [Armatimonadota bacterium]
MESIESEKLTGLLQNLQDRLAELDRRAADLSVREEALLQREHQVANLTQAEAERRVLLRAAESLQREIKHREVELEAQLEHAARQKLLTVMERQTAAVATEATMAVVSLPNDEIKGRLIGRDGRNIRSFEQVTGVDLIIDDTPGVVTVSSFDPVRRETARVALINLMLDGRIHPARIEELYEQAQAQMSKSIREAGIEAAREAEVQLPTALIETVGHLRFRQTYGQNGLAHSIEVALIGASIAGELGFDESDTRIAGFLHDIGKVLGPEYGPSHALAGMEFVRPFGFSGRVLNAIGAHHNEIEPTSPEAQIVIIADKLSAARPGARRGNLEHYVTRMSELESIASAYPGVDRAFAVQAGRELRVFVKPLEVNDDQTRQVAEDLSRAIQSQHSFPGSIKVVVIREYRVQSNSR